MQAMFNIAVKQPIQYVRPANRTTRMETERPMLNFSLAAVDPATTIYQRG